MLNLTSLKGMTLLFVEDEMLLQTQLQETLSIFFGRVFVASNGQEALRLLADESIHIILSDIKMPIMDGLTLTRHIRLSKNHIPLILMSSYSDQSILLEAANAGIDGYIIKPIQLNELLACVTNVLSRKQIISYEFCFGNDVVYNLRLQELYHRGQVVELGKRERALLALFITNPDKTIPKDKILTEIWNDSVTDSAIKNLIARLRVKIGCDVIVAVKGAGWRLNIQEH